MTNPQTTAPRRRKPNGPRLTADQCEHIRHNYYSKDSRETLGSLARLYRVSTTTILKIARGTYRPADETADHRKQTTETLT